ncbi:hypothetical protein SCHPADRAFT_221937 [Schizopora paradoxa]|uniref:Dynamin N-terminal domain-containing protein n=1 Tax=Schizopora paradoxa TaxID=27342 RepID=A0A0H2RWS2_9AGAM|nr:hypothetical protein SCHPADRAFT_221937 [Schizopora paradoxa]
MDPVSLSTIGLKVVAKFTLDLYEKAEQVEKVRKRESEFARLYKKRIKDLADEAENFSILMNFTVQEGNKRAVKTLLTNDDGNNALKKLVTMLDTTRGFLAAQDEAASTMLASLSKKKRRRIAEAFGVRDEEVAFDVVMKEASSSLDAHRTDLRRQYDLFHKLYFIILNSPEAHGPSRMHSPATLRQQADREERIRARQAEIQREFYDRPFQYTLSTDAALDIAKDVDISRGKSNGSESYISTVKELGRNWADDNTPTLSELSIKKLADIQATLLEKLLTNIEFELAGYSLKASAGESCDGVTDDLRCAHLALMRSTMLREVERNKTKRFSIAFCGMVKAGKSTFLNALMGESLLPSDDLPATAWPCRVLHSPDQQEPSLILDPKYFQGCINSLRAKGYGNMMRDYNPPKIFDDYSAILFDDLDETVTTRGTLPSPTIEDEIGNPTLKDKISRCWIDLHPKTKQNLLRFEEPNFVLPEEAIGKEAVIDLLGLVNDIIRLCIRFDIKKPDSKSCKWPLLKVNFECLREHVLDGEFEFIDLPGVGVSGREFYEFQDLVREASKIVNAVVPIISFKEIPKEDWRQQLPGILKIGTQRPPDLVLCTHFDHARDCAYELIGDVAKTFWPKAPERNRGHILPVATRIGISSCLLLQMSQKQKPRFQDIWQEDSIFYDCAVKILGDWQSEVTYDRMHVDTWRQKLKEQLDKSGLQESITRLVNDIVITSHQRTLVDENLAMCKQLRKGVGNQHRLILEMQRSQEDYEKAYSDFLEVREKYETVLAEWEADRTKGNLKAHDNLSKHFQSAQKKIIEMVDELVERKIKEFCTCNELTRTPADKRHGLRMTFSQISKAEVFLEAIQSGAVDIFTAEKKRLVEYVRDLAGRTRSSYFKSLRDKIKTRVGDDTSQFSLKEDIMAELSEKGATIGNLIFVNIRQSVMHTIAVRHSGASAYRAIQDAIARPFLNQRPIDVFLNLNAAAPREDEWKRGVENLGFMLRAPITVVASLSWLLGSGVWPFMRQSERIVIDKRELLDHLRKQLLAKIFEDLRKEGESTLAAMMDGSWVAAKSVVEDELKSEEQRYNSEAALKRKPLSEEKLAPSLSTLLNFVAAESAMSKLRTDMQGSYV